MASLPFLTQRISFVPGKKWTVRVVDFVTLSSLSVLLGKYVGNRPVKLRKAETNVRSVDIGHRKSKQLERERKKDRGNPY